MRLVTTLTSRRTRDTAYRSAGRRGCRWVVGDNDQRAIFGDLFEIVRRDGTADIEVFQYLFDRIKPLQVAVTVGKLLKLFLIK